MERNPLSFLLKYQVKRPHEVFQKINAKMNPIFGLPRTDGAKKTEEFMEVPLSERRIKQDQLG